MKLEDYPCLDCLCVLFEYAGLRVTAFTLNVLKEFNVFNTTEHGHWSFHITNYHNGYIKWSFLWSESSENLRQSCFIWHRVSAQLTQDNQKINFYKRRFAFCSQKEAGSFFYVWKEGKVHPNKLSKRQTCGGNTQKNNDSFIRETAVSAVVKAPMEERVRSFDGKHMLVSFRVPEGWNRGFYQGG